jgi:DNA-binding winged helix-turn-helix (wHTH) protein
MAGAGEQIVELADRTVDLVRQAVLFPDGSSRSLTTRETQLLGFLARRPEEDVSRDELLEKVWEYRANYATRAVDVAMRRLRAKVEPDPDNPIHLLAVHGVGYRFVPPPSEPLALPLAPAAPTPDAPRSNLRPERSSFVGRQAELAELSRRFQGATRVVSLLGPGGVGKTRLATRFGADQLARWPGGVWLVELSQADGVAGVAAAVGAAL